MKQVLKRVLAVFLCIMMLGGVAPMAGVVQWVGGLTASAITLDDLYANKGIFPICYAAPSFNRGVSATHWGVDYGCPIGTPIVAAYPGVVVRVDFRCIHNNNQNAGHNCSESWGNCIEIGHDINGDGSIDCYAYYMHLYYGSAMVSVGTEVYAGQQIAKSASTGSSSGGHLHFEIQLTQEYSAGTGLKIDDYMKFQMKRISAPIQYRGAVEAVVGKTGSVEVQGWYVDISAKDTVQTVTVCLGGPKGGMETEETTVQTTEYSETANAECGVTGNHGFAITMPTKKTGIQPITVYAPNGESLYEGTVNILKVGGGDYSLIEFGSYPQSKVTDSSVVSQLNAQAPAWDNWTSYGYYSGAVFWDDGQMTPNNYMRYVDITLNENKYRGVKFTSYRPYCTGGTSSAYYSYQDDNGYSTNTVYWFKYDPLQWRVLDPATGLVLCETIIDSQAYNNYSLSSGKDAYGYTAIWGDAGKTHYANNYVESSIRQWMNNDFYNTAFSATQQDIIETTTLENKAYSTSYSAYDSASTNDKIFFLSVSDVQNTSYGFSSNISRRTSGSDYAKCQGLYVTTSTGSDYLDAKGNKCSDWRLRSAGDSSGHAFHVSYDGVACDYYYTYYAFVGVRPALRLNLTSDFFPSENGFVTNGVTAAHVVPDYKNQNAAIAATRLDGSAVPLDGTNGEKDFVLPGLNQTDNMVPQGIAYWPQKGQYLVSLYCADGKSGSKICALDGVTGKFLAQYNLCNANGTAFNGHMGGLGVSGYNLYFSDGKGINSIPLSSLQLTSEDVANGNIKTVTVGTKTDCASVMNNANISYVNVVDNVLYAGNFYSTDENFKTPAGDTHSALLAFTLSGTSADAERNSVVPQSAVKYNIDNQYDHIQSAFIKDGVLIASRSFDRRKDSWLTALDASAGAATVVSEICTTMPELKGPCMMEDMVLVGNDLYFLTESAAHVYRTGTDGKGKSSTPTDVVWKLPLDAWKTNSVELKTKAGKVVVNDLIGSDFDRDPATYSSRMATYCADVAMGGYATTATLKENLQKLDYTVESCNLTTNRDEVNYFIASKTITVSGKERRLLFVGLIGSRRQQWYSNFDPQGRERADSSLTTHWADTHDGFMDAKNYVQGILDGIIAKSDQPTTLLITGHSRGAAAANLLTAYYIDNTPANCAKDRIFCYAFATPNSTSKINRSAERYMGIHNIVNPEDFVTKVMLAKWKYGRYGQTHTLPSSTDAFIRSSYLPQVRSAYKTFTNGGTYDPYTLGQVPVNAIIAEMGMNLKTPSEMYSKEFALGSGIPVSLPLGLSKTTVDFMKETILPIVAKEDVSATTLIGQVWKYLTNAKYTFFGNLLMFFAAPDVDTNKLDWDGIKGTFGRRFEEAHCMETYAAFMHSATAEMILKPKTYSSHSVNCPVDIEVYDNINEELVLRIQNNVIDETVAAGEHAIIAYVDGDSKNFILPDDGSYSIYLTGNDEGTMDYIVTECDPDVGEESRNVFFEVPVEEGKTMVTTVTEETDFSTLKLFSEDGNFVEKDEQIDEQVRTCTISASCPEEQGEVAVSSSEPVVGDCVSVLAQAKVNYIFDGWYENNELVSAEAAYSFVAKTDRALTAKFVPCTHDYDVLITKEASSDKEGEKTFTCRICNHSYTEPIPMLQRMVKNVVVSNATVQYKSPLTLQPVIVADEGTKYKVVYASSDAKIASVDKNGNITTHKMGTVTITCTVTNEDVPENVVESTCTVTVKYAWWQVLIRILLLGFLWY